MKTNQPNNRQTDLNLGFSLTEELANISDDLVSAIVQLIMFRVGRENSISRKDMMNELRSRGYRQSERTVRLAISELRSKYGIPIAGTGGINGGYWLLKDRQEAEDYCKV